MKTSNEKQSFVKMIHGGNDNNVTINSLYLYMPSLVASPEQDQSFNESKREKFTSSCESWVTDRKPVSTGNEYQLDIGLAANINVPLYLRAAHQKTQRDNPARLPDQFYNAVLDNNDVKR